MIQPEMLQKYFPPYLRDSKSYQKYMLKEYLQLLILDYLTTTPYLRRIVFIGGTNLRLTRGIDRFSEDIDFDCKGLTKAEFLAMTDGIVKFLQRNGYQAHALEKEQGKLIAYRRNIYFPGLLFDLNLSGYKNERFLIKIEAQDQKIDYATKMAIVKGCGFFFSFPVPTDQIMCAMKVSALLSRQKGRDFYDTMFLMGQNMPDFEFLSAKSGIHNLAELKKAFSDLLLKIDLNKKAKDFEHLVFQKRNSKRILLFGEFVKDL